jgi:enoyl-CoA hydratase/carnithine racemase
MKYEDVLFEKEDGVAVLTLDRPDRYNAFSPKMRVSIVRAIDDVANDPETRVLILTGAGKGFCTGFDWMLSGGKLDLSLERPDKIGLGKRYLGAPIGWIALWLRGLTKPTICAVNGVAAGGGLGLALACDILIASEEARFSSAFARRGLVPDSGVTSFLPKLVGRAKALELMWTGDIIDAQEALRIGLVSKVVPHE